MALSNLRMAELTHQVWHAALTRKIQDFNMMLCRDSSGSLKEIDRMIKDILQAKEELDYIKGSMDYYSEKVQQLWQKENKECKS
jgi:uncharacterized protein YvpB